MVIAIKFNYASNKNNLSLKQLCDNNSKVRSCACTEMLISLIELVEQS